MKNENEYRLYGGKNLHPLLRVVMGLVGIALICFAILATIVCVGKRTHIQGTPKVMIILAARWRRAGRRSCCGTGWTQRWTISTAWTVHPGYRQRRSGER